MEVVWHPLVKRDVLEILHYYHQISSRLADEFQAELRATIDQAATTPERFPRTKEDFRRANLRRFPFHVLYEVQQDAIRIMLVRHHKRHPKLGVNRK